MDSMFSYSRKTVDGAERIREMTTGTKLIIQEAEKLGIRWKLVPHTTVISLTYKEDTVFFHRRISPNTSSLAEHSCVHKQVTRNLLHAAGVQVSKGFIVQPTDSEAYAKKIFNSLQTPLVVKPSNSSLGKGVHVYIKSIEAFLEAISNIKQLDETASILVEEQFIGHELRIVATPEKIVSAIKRVPPHVVGDGVSTIESLATTKSTQHAAHPCPALKPICLDDAAQTFLKIQGLSLQSIPTLNQTVYFQDHALLAIDRGGDTIEVTDQLHPSIERIATQAIAAVPGLAWGGIDFMCHDHRVTQTKNSYRVIEINASPCLDWQQMPFVGQPKNVVGEFLLVAFPELRQTDRVQSSNALHAEFNLDANRTLSV